MFIIHYANDFDPYSDGLNPDKVFENEYTWNQIFLSISTTLLKPTTESEIMKSIEETLLGEYQSISRDDFQTILIQLMALKLIQTDILKSDGIHTYWILTPYGREEMVRLKALKK